MYQMKRFIDMEHSFCLPVCFCFHQLGLCSVSYTVYWILYLSRLYYYKWLSISFSREIIVQDFETVTFYVLFVYKPTFSVIFCWIKRVRVSRKFKSFHPIHFHSQTYQSCKRVYWSEDAQANTTSGKLWHSWL